MDLPESLIYSRRSYWSSISNEEIGGTFIKTIRFDENNSMKIIIRNLADQNFDNNDWNLNTKELSSRKSSAENLQQ